MLFIDIQGATKSQESICKDVLTWYTEMFLSDYDFDITIEHSYVKEHSATMHVSGELEEPREFTIEVHKYLNGKEYIMTLIHEMIHIEDYIKGNLTEQDGKRYWKGVLYENEDYDIQPWEIRAAALESGFYDLYANTNA